MRSSTTQTPWGDAFRATLPQTFSAHMAQFVRRALQPRLPGMGIGHLTCDFVLVLVLVLVLECLVCGELTTDPCVAIDEVYAAANNGVPFEHEDEHDCCSLVHPRFRMRTISRSAHRTSS
jgi:hypothetical protein